MHETKRELLDKNGCRCMLCGQVVPYHEITWHHIVPKSISKANGLPPDNSYDNGSLVCVRCHSYIHLFNFYDDEYQNMMQIILEHKV